MPRYAFGAMPSSGPAGESTRAPAAIIATAVPCPVESRGEASSGVDVAGSYEFCRRR